MIQAWLPALASWDEDFDVDLTEGQRSELGWKVSATGEPTVEQVKATGDHQQQVEAT